MISVKDDTEFGTFFGLLPIGLIIGFAGFSLLRDAPPEPPPASALTGCFSSPDAPPIKLDGAQARFGKGGPGPIRYELSFAKQGTIDLDFNSPVRLKEAPDGSWIFVGPKDGWSYRVRLAHVVNGKAYGVRMIADADYIEFTADDGSLHAFRPTNSEICQVL